MAAITIRIVLGTATTAVASSWSHACAEAAEVVKVGGVHQQLGKQNPAPNSELGSAWSLSRFESVARVCRSGARTSVSRGLAEHVAECLDRKG